MGSGGPVKAGNYRKVDPTDKAQREKVRKYASKREVFGPKGCLAQCIEFSNNTIRGTFAGRPKFYKVYIYGRHVGVYDIELGYRDVKDEAEIVNVYGRAVLNQTFLKNLEGVWSWLAVDMAEYKKGR